MWDAPHGPADLGLLRQGRAAKSRHQRVPLPVAEAQAIRQSLITALEAVWEAKATLEKYGGE